MATFWWVLGLVVLIVVGNALVLLRPARRSKPPDTVKPKPYEDEDDANSGG